MYCSIQDIRREFGNSVTFSPSASLDVADVEAIIKQESTAIDSFLYPKYVTPIDSVYSPKAFDLLKTICITKVVNRVKPIYDIKTGSNSTDQDAKKYSEKPRDLLREIIDGKLRLIDAVIATPDDGLAFGVRAENYAPFELNKQQW